MAKKAPEPKKKGKEKQTAFIKVRVKSAGVFVLICFLLMSVGSHWLVRTAIETGVAQMTGLGLKIDQLRLGFRATDVWMQGVRVLNPEGFPEPAMIEIPALYVDFDFGALLRGLVHIEQLSIDLDEFIVVRNPDGQVNVNSIRLIQDQKKKQRSVESEAGRPSFVIDRLELKIGRVVYLDYRRSTPPDVKEFRVDLHEQYHDIRDAHTLMSLILVQAFAKTTARKLLDANWSDLKSVAGGFAGEVVSSTYLTIRDVAGHAGRTIGQKTKVIVGDVAQSLTPS